MVKADPKLGWLKEANQRGDVDWRLVKETHDSFKYSHSGMGTGAMLVVVIVVTVLTAGSGTASAIGATASTTASSAAVAADASTATAKDVTSSDSIKGYLKSGLTAGFAAGVLDEELSTARSDAIKGCKSRECADGIVANTISMDDLVAQDLLTFFRGKIAYDIPGLLVGNPDDFASPPQGFDKWGATYVTDDQMAKAKYIQEGWLTPDEAVHLDEWVKGTSWMERAAGRELSVSERARMLTEMGDMLLTNGWGSRAPKPGISTGKVEGKGPGISADADGFGLNGAKGNQLINGKWVDAEGLPLPVPSSVGASGRVPNVLQTGGNTLNKRTANVLNEHFGESLAPREWGRALEALKADVGRKNGGRPLFFWRSTKRGLTPIFLLT